MSFGYNPNTPVSSNDPADDQPDMQTNFASIDGFVAVDHVGFNAISGGTHKQVTMKSTLGADPVIVAPDPTGVLYTKLVSGMSQAFFANYQGGQQITGFAKNFATPGYANLPGGLQIRFGTGTVGSGGFSSYNFNANFSNACLVVVANCLGGTATIGVQGFTNAKFDAKSSSGTVSFNYVAIGY